MELSNLLSNSREIEVEFPKMEGFIVNIVYLSKDELRKIMEKSKVYGYDTKSRQPEETTDDKLFTKLYTQKALVGWKGLKYEYLKELVLVDPATLPEEGELEYSPENAVTLVTQANSFDSWLTTIMSDVSLFNKGS